MPPESEATPDSIGIERAGGQVAEAPTTAQTYLLDGEEYGPSLGAVDRRDALDVIQREVEACQRCAELAASRTKTVFGIGNLTPRLVFVGEGPGAEEDRTGEPFVGAGGQMLNRILAACKLKREDVYILNTVKCRPPGNRNPSQSELDNCWGYAERQLEILRPEFICCLGSVAAKRVLGTTQSLGRLRRTVSQIPGQSCCRHLSSGLSVAKRKRQKARLGGYETADERNGNRTVEMTTIRVKFMLPADW